MCIPIRSSIVVVIVLLAGSCFIGVSDWGTKEQARLNRQIDTDLPVGSSKERVKEWLAAHGFAAEDAKGFDGQTSAVHANLYREYLLDWNGWIRIRFNFDEEGRLKSHTVEWDANYL